MLLNHFLSIIMYISTGKTQASVFSTSGGDRWSPLSTFQELLPSCCLILHLLRPPQQKRPKLGNVHRKSWGNLMQCYQKLHPSA